MIDGDLTGGLLHQMAVDPGFRRKLSDFVQYDCKPDDKVKFEGVTYSY